MVSENLRLPRARAVITHSRPVGYDEKRGVYLYEVVDESEAWNLVTDAGRVAIHTYIYGTSAQRTTAGLGSGLNFIALSNDGAAPAAGDLTLAGELIGDGLSRAIGTVTLPVGSGTSTTIQHVFTYTGVAAQAVQKTALFDQSGPPPAGKMAHEILFPSRTLYQNDTLTVTYTITLA